MYFVIKKYLEVDISIKDITKTLSFVFHFFL